MTSYLLAENGDVLNSEATERLIWDVSTSGASAFSGAGTCGLAGLRMGLAQTPISAIATPSIIGRRITRAATAWAGSATPSLAGIRIALGEVEDILCSASVAVEAWRILFFQMAIAAAGSVVAVGRRLWESVTPASDTWTAQQPAETVWTEVSASDDTWTPR